MGIQNIDLRRKDFEASHPAAKTFIFNEETMLYSGPKVEILNDQWTTWCACIGIMHFESLKSQAIPEGFVLDAPARVGGGSFQTGVKWSTVIEAAQRHYLHDQDKTSPEALDILKKVLSGDFVLMPKECSDEMAEVIATTANVCGGIAGDIYDAVIKQAVVVEVAEGE